MNVKEALKIELNRIVDAPRTGFYTIEHSGQYIKAATESDTIRHLTTKDHCSAEPGREYRIAGIGGWRFESTIKEVGFKIVYARNSRNQPCRIVVRASDLTSNTIG